nr:7723_t:CDS:2 [Entrophospora candida]
MGAANTKCISENRVLSKNKATFRIKKQFSNSSNSSSSSSYKKTLNCSECKQPTIENNLMIGGEWCNSCGFSNVYFGNWKDGNLLQWDCKKKQWIRSSDMVVTLKSLKSFVNNEDDFFSEQKRSLEVCTTFRASDFINKNNNNGTEKNEGGKDKGEVLFHRSDTSLHRQKSADTYKSNESFIHHNVNLEQLRTPSMIESGRTAIYTDLLKRKQKAADRFFFYIEPDNSAATIIECELSPKKFDDDKQDIINEKHYTDYDDYNDNYEDYEDPLMDGRNKIYTTQQPFRRWKLPMEIFGRLESHRPSNSLCANKIQNN